MCFGGSQTQTTQTTPTPNPAVAAGATQSLSAAENLQNTGFTPYSGEMVAGFSPQQMQSFGLGNTLATGPTSAYAQGYVNNAGGVPQQNVGSAPTIASQMTPYMNQYVGMALQPQIQGLENTFAAQNQANNAAATSSGAFGDARAGIQTAVTGLMQDQAMSGLIGSAYTNAFNTAIGAGAQDVSNTMAARSTNANLANQYAQTQLAAATGQEGAGQYSENLIGLENTLGAQQTAQMQAKLNAAYNQWLMGEQYPFQTSQNLNQSVAAGSQAMPASTTQVTTQPNNSGFGVLGSLLGASMNGGNAGFSGSAMGQGMSWLAGLPMFSDERVKEDIEQVGELADETPVYTFKYKADPFKRTVLGVMAQDVEKTNPEAVVEIGGIKAVDYRKATEPSRRLMASILPMAA